MTIITSQNSLMETNAGSVPYFLMGRSRHIVERSCASDAILRFVSCRLHILRWVAITLLWSLFLLWATCKISFPRQSCEMVPEYPMRYLSPFGLQIIGSLINRSCYVDGDVALGTWALLPLETWNFFATISGLQSTRTWSTILRAHRYLGHGLIAVIYFEQSWQR